MTITLRQLQDVAEGSGGTVESALGIGGQLLKASSGMSLYGMLAELAQLGLEAQHVSLRASQTAWIHPDGVWV